MIHHMEVLVVHFHKYNQQLNLHLNVYVLDLDRKLHIIPRLHHDLKSHRRNIYFIMHLLEDPKCLHSIYYTCFSHFD